ncbi:hypothetical protein [Ignavibacterium sp.]|uniref:hypothetical protein n=1 Tax=Ignavibacterium sp. TaxID=2651167 RepID=UPI0025C344D0|nr:hypothetical protein [Ignavibacterium sp.]
MDHKENIIPEKHLTSQFIVRNRALIEKSNSTPKKRQNVKPSNLSKNLINI